MTLTTFDETAREQRRKRHGFVHRSQPHPSARSTQRGFADSMSAHSISDLRKKSAEELLKAPRSQMGLIVDGWVLPEDVYSTFLAGMGKCRSDRITWNRRTTCATHPACAANCRLSDYAPPGSAPASCTGSRGLFGTRNPPSSEVAPWRKNRRKVSEIFTTPDHGLVS